MELRHLVVGLELGQLSNQAVARAMSLAREFGARLEVVHGAGLEGRHLTPARRAFLVRHGGDALARATAAARGKLELMVEDPVFAGRPVEDYLRVRPEVAAEALLAAVRASGADLLVIGAHRQRKPFDFGGTGRAVLARSPCPVWVEPADGQRFERILAPVDLSPSTDLVLAAARSLAARFDVPVRVLHVFVPPELAYVTPLEPGPRPASVIDALREEERGATRALVGAFDWGPLPVETEFAEGQAADVILAHAGPRDLVVMGTHGHTGLARAVLGSTAYRVLRHAVGPMLVVPQRAERYPEAGHGV